MKEQLRFTLKDGRVIEALEGASYESLGFKKDDVVKCEFREGNGWLEAWTQGKD